MPTRTADSVVGLFFRGTLAGQEVETTFFYQMAVAITAELLDAITLAASNIWNSDFLPLLPPSYVMTQVYAYDMTAGATAQSFNETNEGNVGTRTGVAMPGNVTVAIARKSGKRGRSYAGRIFWPGLTEYQLSSQNVVDAAEAALMIAAITNLDNAMALLNGLAVVLSFTHDGVFSSEAVISAVAEWVFTNLAVDSRRRRLPGRGV